MYKKINTMIQCSEGFGAEIVQEVKLTQILSQGENASQVHVAHAYNPSYSGGRDQEDHGSKPAQASSSQDPISKIPITK
jgi:hypothetical protein